jgi:hypothetical protein
MRVHQVINIKKTVKLVRFVKNIKKDHFDDFLKAANSDARLTQDQIDILDKTKKAIKETKIEISNELAKKGRDAIVSFVENKIVETFKRI